MGKWAIINMAFVLVWLALNHPLDRALGIPVGSVTDWTLYMSVLVVVCIICSVAGANSKG